MDAFSSCGDNRSDDLHGQHTVMQGAGLVVLREEARQPTPTPAPAIGRAHTVAVTERVRGAALRALNRRLVDGELIVDEYRMAAATVRHARTGNEIRAALKAIEAPPQHRLLDPLASTRTVPSRSTRQTTAVLGLLVVWVTICELLVSIAS